MPRQLATLIEPALGEAFHSWIVRLAGYLHVPVGYVPGLLGLECAPSAPVRPRYFGIALTNTSRLNIARATGLPAAEFDAMQLATLHGRVLDLHDFPACMNRMQYAAQMTSRVCPDCLAESGGVWQLWWRLAFAAVCPTHRLLLHDTCPRCRHRFGPGGLGRDFEWRVQEIKLTRSQMVDPMQCGAQGIRPGSCAFPLEDLPRIRAPEFLVEAQTRYLAGLPGKQTPLGTCKKGASVA
jgi:hypothetical protein